MVLNTLLGPAATTRIWSPDLTQRENEIVGCLVARLHDKEIEEQLGIKHATLHAHLQHIYRKLGVANRKQLVAKCLGLWRRKEGGTSSPF